VYILRLILFQEFPNVANEENKAIVDMPPQTVKSISSILLHKMASPVETL